LKDSVAEAMRSPHANYVLQKIIKVLTPAEARFVVEEINEDCLEWARHEYGCRIYCRLFEHWIQDKNTTALMDLVLADAEGLMRHTFGHHVVECALDHGLPHQKQQIFAALRKNFLRNAGNRNAAYVVEKAIVNCGPSDQQTMFEDLLNHTPGDVATLARSQCGSMVLRALLRLHGPLVQQLQEHLRLGAPHVQLKGSRHCRRLLDGLTLPSLAKVSEGDLGQETGAMGGA